ncbi:glycerophosphoryl diester phosphodiesterase membrane domain-containing protein [Cyanobacteria bacterium FACHB-471]|nr:glycerophosphoryl diester phosphodiesterase membrane domain-containing protein [Cyanobacteria bacterium FACHB-471]
MTANPNPQNLVQPLDVGNVVSAGIQLYRTHFQQYIGISLIATLWALLPFLLIIPIILFYTAVQAYYGTLGLVIPAWIVLTIYCSAKYFAGAGAIARLAFTTLVNQPESVESAKRYADFRMWSFWNINFLLLLMYLGVYFVAVIALLIVLAATGAFSLLTNPDPFALTSNPGPLILTGLFVLLLVLAIVFVFVWLSSRLAVADLPLAVESGSNATQSLGRSWNLTHKSAWRIALILFIAFLITIPLQALAQILVSTFDSILAASFPRESPTFALLSFSTSYILGLVAGVLVLPLWQAIKAVIYSDLRSRREGLGLKLRDS